MMHDDQQYEIHSEEHGVEKVEELFKMWNQRLLKGSTAHLLMALHCDSRDRNWSTVNLFGSIIVVVLSAAKGFSPGSIEPSFKFTVTIAEAKLELYFPPVFLFLASLGVLLSSAWQYLNQYPSRAASHRLTAVEYANLRRKLERYWTKQSLHYEALHSLSRTYNQIARYAPLVPDNVWRQAHALKAEEAAKISANFFSGGKDQQAE